MALRIPVSRNRIKMVDIAKAPIITDHITTITHSTMSIVTGNMINGLNLGGEFKIIVKEIISAIVCWLS